MENKVDIVAELSVLLRLTRKGEGVSLVYKQKPNGDEYVDIYHKGAFRKSIHVTDDSGIAMCRRIINDI